MSDQVGNPEDQFSHNEARMILFEFLIFNANTEIIRLLENLGLQDTSY